MITKLFEIVLLQRLTPFLEAVGFPDFSQTAYQKGISCSDAIFATQEALLTHARDNGKPFLYFYGVEKAFDSVELPILLKELWAIGINGKLWRIVKNWYTASSGKVKIQNHISSSLQISHCVKQGSVLSPTFFLIVIYVLLKRMRESNCGLSVRGTYMGAATNADDIRTTAPSKKSVSTQADIVSNFMKDTCLELNSSKLEIVKISQPQENVSVQIDDVNICTTSSAKCLGVWWQSNLSAKRSVHENIYKARSFFLPWVA